VCGTARCTATAHKGWNYKEGPRRAVVRVTACRHRAWAAKAPSTWTYFDNESPITKRWELERRSRRSSPQLHAAPRSTPPTTLARGSRGTDEVPYVSDQHLQQ